TTNAESDSCESTGKAARKSPDSPPTANTATKPSAHSTGGTNEMLRWRRVASQLKTFTATGTVSTSAVTMNAESNPVPSPTTNRCSPQAKTEKTAIPTVAQTTAL